MLKRVSIVFVLGIAACSGCSTRNATRPMVQSPSTPAEVCHDADLRQDDTCVPGAELLERLTHEEFDVLEVVPAPGTTPAMKVLARFEREPQLSVLFKWRVVPSEVGDAFNNSPRRELAAAAVADLLYGSNQEVVPHSTMLCVEREEFPTLVGDAEPTFEGDDCVVGLITPWIYNAEEIKVLWDPERFAKHEGYRMSVARLNVLAEVIHHGDSHSRNVLVDDAEAPTRVFLIDNSFAFSGLFNPMVRWFGSERDWASPVVPRLPSALREELLKFDPVDFDKLATVAVLNRTGDDWALVGLPRPRGDEHPAIDPDEGVRHEGYTVQLGLTQDEIVAMRKRFARLLENEGDRTAASK